MNEAESEYSRKHAPERYYEFIQEAKNPFVIWSFGSKYAGTLFSYYVDTIFNQKEIGKILRELQKREIGTGEVLRKWLNSQILEKSLRQRHLEKMPFRKKEAILMELNSSIFRNPGQLLKWLENRLNFETRPKKAKLPHPKTH